MPDIFISYAHEDQERVRPIVKELEKRWSVFWDKKIPPGKTWEDSIGKALEESPCVLVVWSNSSVKSDWVKEEADVARKRDTLVPLFLDTVEPPMGFRRIHAADLSDWKNNNAHQGFQLLIGAIESKISPVTLPVTDSRPASKPDTVSLEGAGHTSPQRKLALQPVGNVGWAQKNQLVIVVAVVMLVILGVVWSIMKQSPPSKVENKPAPSTEVVEGNPEADARRKVEDARLTAVKEAAARREAPVVNARQEAEPKKTLKIGDEYSGGKIAWLDTSGQHGLIAAKADIPGPYYSWEDAKAKCAALGDGWHLPTKDELNKLYHAKSAVGGFSDYYDWSSTEDVAIYAWYQYFSSGYHANDDESSRWCVRAVRAF